METQNIKPEQGTLLISEPFLNDFYFGRSVVLLAEHNKEGSFGLILNKPVDVRVNEAIKDFPSTSRLFIGGPVKTDNLFVLHTLGDKIEESTKVMDGIYWGGNIDIIKQMLIEKKIKDDEIRFFVGYAGWVEKQLMRELKEQAWVMAKSDAYNLMHLDPEQMWKTFLRTLGKEYLEWLNYPIDPILN
jgi:putative transcriptional regulator